MLEMALYGHYKYNGILQIKVAFNHIYLLP